MAEIPRPQQNHILDALPQAERERLFPHLKLVALPLGSALYESGDMLRHIYFPTDARLDAKPRGVGVTSVTRFRWTGRSRRHHGQSEPRQLLWTSGDAYTRVIVSRSC